MKEYRSWSDYWRNLKSKYKPSVIRDSYFFTDLEKDKEQEYYELLQRKSTKSKS